MLDVLASLGEGVKTHEKGVGGDLPLILGLGLVLEVGILELRADVESQNQFLVSLHWLFTLNESEDLGTIDVVAASIDDGIADLSDQHDQSRWSVVVLRVSPDQPDGVHDWDEQISGKCKLLRVIRELVEEIEQGLEVLVVLVGLSTGG